ncbi:transporter substrate-binding domain-containing protein [Rubrivivax gelatinosus]|uniref:transporter substrate-binding domain-containing protein n=1 Tax=Rubrivivax gelatinosus TaxID=28068 RepID=UPI001A911536|nr:transporter substrate-binding domain-containing protein [Rubrivivax gelatinosus]
MPLPSLWRTLLAAAAVALMSLPALAQQTPLSPAQQDWLARSGVLRVAPERDYGPFIYLDDEGRVSGLSVEMLDLVQRRTGVALRWMPARPLAQQLEAARRREVDLLTSLRPTPQRSGYLLFTRPYVKVPAILVQRQGLPPTSLASMRGRSVAVGTGYAVEPVVRAAHPEVAWVGVSDDLQALRGVLEGRFDAAVVDAASAGFVIRHHQLAGLAGAGEVGFEYELSFAVRSDWPELRAILDAGIAAVPESERDALLQRWLGPLDADTLVERAPVATRVGILLLLFAVLAGALLYAQRVRVERAEPRPRGRRPPP